MDILVKCLFIRNNSTLICRWSVYFPNNTSIPITEKKAKEILKNEKFILLKSNNDTVTFSNKLT